MTKAVVQVKKDTQHLAAKHVLKLRRSDPMKLIPLMRRMTLTYEHARCSETQAGTATTHGAFTALGTPGAADPTFNTANAFQMLLADIYGTGLTDQAPVGKDFAYTHYQNAIVIGVKFAIDVLDVVPGGNVNFAGSDARAVPTDIVLHAAGYEFKDVTSADGDASAIEPPYHTAAKKRQWVRLNGATTAKGPALNALTGYFSFKQVSNIGLKDRLKHKGFWEYDTLSTWTPLPNKGDGVAATGLSGGGTGLSTQDTTFGTTANHDHQPKMLFCVGNACEGGHQVKVTYRLRLGYDVVFFNPVDHVDAMEKGADV